jgi:nucleotide-binding universal stress UspA family protein
VPRDEEAAKLLQFGLARLAALGVTANGQVVNVGEPADAIADCARDFRADLIVVGHRRQTLLERWWSGPSGAYVSDRVNCSVLIARNFVSDEEVEASIAGAEAAGSGRAPAR